MATSRTLCMLRLILCLGFYICATTSIQDANDIYCGLSNANDIHRSDFPSSFIFGVSSSSYQYEGAVNEGGNGATNYDRFAHTPGNVRDGSTADVTEDQYHRYKEDIDLMRELGVDYYRFAISWSRIFPEGRHFVNKEGIAYYNDLIDGLIEKGTVNADEGVGLAAPLRGRIVGLAAPLRGRRRRTTLLFTTVESPLSLYQAFLNSRFQEKLPEGSKIRGMASNEEDVTVNSAPIRGEKRARSRNWTLHEILILVEAKKHEWEVYEVAEKRDQIETAGRFTGPCRKDDCSL